MISSQPLDALAAVYLAFVIYTFVYHGRGAVHDSRGAVHHSYGAVNYSHGPVYHRREACST